MMNDERNLHRPYSCRLRFRILTSRGKEKTYDILHRIDGPDPTPREIEEARIRAKKIAAPNSKQVTLMGRLPN